MRVGSTLYYVLKDHLGSANVVTDANGVTLTSGGEQRYLPYGDKRLSPGITTTDKLFTGQRDTGLGIYHYGARFYSPMLGRFLSADTAVPNYANPQSLNRYSYGLNNPSRYTDPDGHRPVEGCGNDGKGACHASDLEKAINAQKLAELEYDPTGQKQARNTEIAETILFDGTELAASVMFEPADWVATAYHCANGDCSPLMLLGLLPIIPSSFGKYGDEISATIARGSGYIDPKLVRFSQDSINYFFKNGDSIDDLADGLRTGEILASDIPPLRLAQNSDGLLFTLDNRRLEAFRRAGIDIPFVLATADEVAAEAWKFTTRTLGETIRIR